MNPYPSRVILLAAGQGSRLGALTAHRPKPLLPIAGEPLLVRTVRQLRESGFDDLTVVVGHRREAVIAALASWRDTLQIVTNPGYATDTNIGSLLLGLRGSDAAALVVEADIAFDDAAIAALAEHAHGPASVWYTNGPFRHHRLGGILRADAQGRVTDLRYTPVNGPEFAAHQKLLGVVQVGPAEMPRFRALLEDAAARTRAQYYMIPWCEHLAELPAVARDLAHCRTATFNTPEEYDRCCALFSANPNSHAA